MDYLVVGSNGFAQVGDPDYYKKNLIEMNYLLKFIREKFPVPERFTSYCFFSGKSFPHDFGTYHEIVLWYDENVLEEWQNSDEEDEQELFSQFWDWFNKIESFDLESEEITCKIEELYKNSLDKGKGNHLKVVRA
jgi:hypothetical protein